MFLIIIRFTIFKVLKRFHFDIRSLITLNFFSTISLFFDIGSLTFYLINCFFFYHRHSKKLPFGKKITIANRHSKNYQRGGLEVVVGGRNLGVCGEGGVDEVAV